VLDGSSLAGAGETGVGIGVGTSRNESAVTAWARYRDPAERKNGRTTPLQGY
jgi:hypothetical protein